MLYRTKATTEILTDLTAKEAFELLKMVRHIQKRFYIGARMIPFDNIPKDDAHDRIQCILNDGTLDIPAHLRGPLERFLELMIDERAPMDMLVEEYNTALNRVFQLELFKPEITGDNFPDKPEPVPEASTKGGDTSHPDAVGPEDRPRDKPEEEARRKILSDYADMTVDCLIDMDMSFSEIFYVIDTARMRLKAERALYRRRLDATPIKGLWAMEERGQQDSA